MKRRFKRTLKRALAMAVASVVTVTALISSQPVTAQAQELVWTHPGKGWHNLPDCDYWKLYERPWANTDAESVYIAETITSIGKYAFYDMPKLRYINMYTSTFIKDMTCFDKEGINLTALR